MEAEGEITTTEKIAFHKAYVDSFVTHKILKVLEADFIIDNIKNKVYGWNPICKNIIDLDSSSKKICYKSVI